MRKIHALPLAAMAALVLSSAAAAQVPAQVPAPPPAPASAVAAPAVPAPPAAPSLPQAAGQKPARPTKAPEAPKAAPEAAPPPEPARAPEPAPGRERIEPEAVNIQFQVTVTAQSASGAPVKRSAILTVSNGTGRGLRSGMLRAGNNVPVATTSLVTRGEDGKETPAAKPLTSYNYRSVGLNVDISEAVLLPGNKIRASLDVEFSGVDEKTGPGASGIPPSFPTFSQRMPLYLESGKPVVVAQSIDQATGASQTVEVRATILR